MNGDDHRARAADDQPRVPAPLRERAVELFVAERGYEPASFQEALAVVLDLAEASSDAATDDDRQDVAASGTSTGRSNAEQASGRSSADGSAVSNEGSAEPTKIELSDPSVDAADGASVSFDEYVDGLEETRQDPSPAVESILDTEHADDAVREIAAEVLDEMTQDAFRELEHGVDEGVAGVTDGMGTANAASGAGTAPSGSAGDGVPDSLTADPESDCAVCGRSHPVSVLQTSILDDDGSVELVCPSCAE